MSCKQRSSEFSQLLKRSKQNALQTEYALLNLMDKLHKIVDHQTAFVEFLDELEYSESNCDCKCVGECDE